MSELYIFKTDKDEIYRADQVHFKTITTDAIILKKMTDDGWTEVRRKDLYDFDKSPVKNGKYNKLDYDEIKSWVREQVEFFADGAIVEEKDGEDLLKRMQRCSYKCE